jgi:hypothetical protein
MFVQYMQALLAANPDMYQSELRDRLMEDRGVPWVSLSTICRALKQNGVTHKKVDLPVKVLYTLCLLMNLQLTRTAAERDEERRFEFRIHMIQNYTPDQLIFVDESSFDRRNTVRTRGYARAGVRAYKRAFLVRKKRFVSTILGLPPLGN